MQMKFIESFLRLYREANMSRASAQLYITQQGLSRQIQALEKELGVSLFQRSKSGVTPTEICIKLYPHFQAMHDEYSSIVNSAAEYRREGLPSLPIAFAVGLSNCINTDFIFDYQKKHREINMQIEEWSQGVCIQKLLTGELELAFLVNPFDERLFNITPLAEDYMFAAIHKDHPLAAEDTPIPFVLLDGENIITGSPENALRGMFDHFCALTNIRPRVIVSSSYSLSFANAMTENAGIVTVTSAMAAKITNPDIVIRRLLTPEPGRMFLCTPFRPKREKELKALTEYIFNYFATADMSRFKET